ncbi:MAG: radical SAM protein [Candidatus Omnitrophota bacterium]|nr:radical SAM protein [Candidatus Omnitrophota bacterium]
MGKLIETYKLEDFFGAGWFPAETDGIKKWAWSGKEAFLNFPPGHKGFSLELSGCPVESANLTLNYKSAKLAAYVLTGSLAKINIPPGTASCGIKLADCWVPKEVLGTPDARELGICLHNIGQLKLYSESGNQLPRIIEMSLTGICNIDPPCVMCVTRNSKSWQQRYHLPAGIIEEMMPYLNSAEFVSLHGVAGEPLLSPKLFDTLSRIDKKVYTMFATNGLLLTKEISGRLISAGLKEIDFSIDAANAVTYSKIRNNNGFPALVKNIKQLISLKKERGVSYPNIIINTVIMKENMPELPAFIDFAHELGVSLARLRFLVPAAENYEVNTDRFSFNYFKQRVDPNSNEFQRIMAIVKDKATKYGVTVTSDNPEISALLNPSPQRNMRMNKIELTLVGDIPQKYLGVIQQEPSCKRPWESVLVYLDGDVRFCCHTHQIIGNLNNNSFIEIWNGQQAQIIRKNFLQNQWPKQCLPCPLHRLQIQAWQN